MNKLIINGDTWGEFSGSTKKKDGTIEIRGYRSYDRLHTVRVMDHPEGLNSNQQIVLEWLQAYADKDSGDKPMQTIFFMWDCIRNNSIDTEVLSAIRMLSRAEQFQVLAAFAAWGQSEVQDDTEV